MICRRRSSPWPSSLLHPHDKFVGVANGVGYGLPIACSCGCRIEVAATDAGLTITCPDCDRQLVVPAWTELQRSLTNGEPLVAQDAEKPQHRGHAASGLEAPDSDLSDEFPFLWTPDWLCRQRINPQALQNFVVAFQKSLRQHFREVPADCALDVGCALLPSGTLLLDLSLIHI